MAALLGMVAGAGLLLIWWSAWEQPKPASPARRSSRLEDLLRAAGIEKVSGSGLAATCLGVGAFTMFVFFAVTRSVAHRGLFWPFWWLAADGHRFVARTEADRLAATVVARRR